MPAMSAPGGRHPLQSRFANFSKETYLAGRCQNRDVTWRQTPPPHFNEHNKSNDNKLSSLIGNIPVDTSE